MTSVCQQATKMLWLNGGRSYGMARIYHQAIMGRCLSTSSQQPPDEEADRETSLLLSPDELALVNVAYDKTDDDMASGVALITLGDGEGGNALTHAMARVFEKTVRRLRKMPNIRAAVLIGQGSNFSSGTDPDFLAEKSMLNMARCQAEMRRFYDMFLSIRRTPFPVIAAINGTALGDGASLALACDIRVASSECKMGFTSVAHGMPPGMGGTHFLPMLTNHQVASQLFLTGEMIGADKAQKLGLVQSTYSPDHLLKEAISLARVISQNSPVAVRSVVQSLRMQVDLYGQGLARTLDREAEQQAIAFASGHVKEGLEALQANRLPVFDDTLPHLTFNHEDGEKPS